MIQTQEPNSPSWGTNTKLVVALTIVVIVGALLVKFQFVITPLLIALLLAYLLHPIASLLQLKLRFSWNRIKRRGMKGDQQIMLAWDKAERGKSGRPVKRRHEADRIKAGAAGNHNAFRLLAHALQPARCRRVGDEMQMGKLGDRMAD